MEELTIKTIPFTKEEFDKIKTNYNDFNNYPIIYILNKEKGAYIEETVNAFNKLHRLNRYNTSNTKNRHDFKHVAD